MNILHALTYGVHEISSRSIIAKILLFLVMAYLFLWMPDIDHAFIDILHHRSIVTHSIIPALLLIVVGRRAGAAPIAGALIGLGVHLSCDMLSPMVGYAQIWLPAPIKAPLGSLSYLWLFANALVAFSLARIIAMKAFGGLVGYPLIFLAGGLTSITYGLINEGSVPAVVVSLTIFTMSLIGTFKRLRLNNETRDAFAKAERTVIRTIDKSSETLEAISGKLNGYTNGLSIALPFRRQRWAVEALIEISEQHIEIRKKLTADPKLAEKYAEVEECFGSTGKEPDYSDVLGCDLLAQIPSCNDPQKIEHLRNVQAVHRDFFEKVRLKLADDPELTKELSAALIEHGGEIVLEQITKSHEKNSGSF